MSEKIIIALIAFFGALLGAVIGNWIRLLIAKKERIDKYKLASLDKKLDVHQNAYFYLEKIWNSSGTEHSDFINEANDWFIKNSLYLHYNSRKNFLTFLNKMRTFQKLEHKREGTKILKECEVLIEKSLKDLLTDTGLPWLDEETSILKPRKD